MAIYLLSVEPEGYKELTLPEGVSFMQADCIRWVGNSKKDTWSVPNLVWLKDDFTDSRDKDADFIKFSGSIVVTEKVKQQLQPILKDQVEFLPVSIDDETRYILNVLNILDILDKAKSKYKIYNDGKVGGCEHAFLNEPGKDQLIYKVEGFLGRTFISGGFLDLLNKLDLSGALIREYRNP